MLCPVHAVMLFALRAIGAMTLVTGPGILNLALWALAELTNYIAAKGLPQASIRYIQPQSLGQHGAAAQAAGGGVAVLRPLAVSLLCGMAHSTERTRAELWANSGLDILLNLLKEPARSRACPTPPPP